MTATATLPVPRDHANAGAGAGALGPGRGRAGQSWRLALTVRSPRSIVVPLLTPVLFALVIAPALANTIAVPEGAPVLHDVCRPGDGWTAHPAQLCVLGPRRHRGPPAGRDARAPGRAYQALVDRGGNSDRRAGP